MSVHPDSNKDNSREADMICLFSHLRQKDKIVRNMSDNDHPVGGYYLSNVPLMYLCTCV